MKQINKQLKEIVQDLKPYKPEKIFLYGSYARGDQRNSSDIDLLIIKKTKKRALDRIDDVTDLLYPKNKFFSERFNLSIDPLILTPKELAEKKRINFFIKKILKESKIIYAA